MSPGVAALAVGAVLAVAALAFVLHPLFFSVSPHARHASRPDGFGDDSAILALREIEFDRATGKLSDSDYAELKQTYFQRALHELRSRESAAEQSKARADDESRPLDAIEARVREYRLTHRSCPTCGVRPEADAAFCSSCGATLVNTRSGASA